MSLQHCNYTVSTTFLKTFSRFPLVLHLGPGNERSRLASLTPMDLILALDAGTTGVRTVAFDRDLRVRRRGLPRATQYFPAPGEVEHDATEIADLAVRRSREVAGALEQTVTTSRRSASPTNEKQRSASTGNAASLFHRAIVWQDRRTAALARSSRPEGEGARVRATTGLVLDSVLLGDEDALAARPRRRRQGARAELRHRSTRGCSGRSPAAPTAASLLTEPSNASSHDADGPRSTLDGRRR